MQEKGVKICKYYVYKEEEGALLWCPKKYLMAPGFETFINLLTLFVCNQNSSNILQEWF